MLLPSYLFSVTRLVAYLLISFCHLVTFLVLLFCIFPVMVIVIVMHGMTLTDEPSGSPWRTPVTPSRTPTSPWTRPTRPSSLSPGRRCVTVLSCVRYLVPFRVIVAAAVVGVAVVVLLLLCAWWRSPRVPVCSSAFGLVSCRRLQRGGDSDGGRRRTFKVSCRVFWTG